MTGNEIVKRARQLKSYKYWYGGKGQIATVSLADRLRRENPSVWTVKYYQKALEDVDGLTMVGDCSFLVCYAYNRSNIGSYNINETYKKYKGTPKNGMILWRTGHVAIYADGLAIQLKSQASDYVEEVYKASDYTNVLYDDSVDYENNHDGNIKQGWIKDSKGDWKYINEKGSHLTGWHFIENEWYYFHDDGTMAKGWLKIDNDWYYMGSYGNMETGWYRITVGVKDDWYFFNSNGEMVTGWHDGFYFDKDGCMVNGKQCINGNHYIFAEDGHLFKGLFAYDGDVYYSADGILQKGEVAVGCDNHICYFGDDYKFVPSKFISKEV